MHWSQTVVGGRKPSTPVNVTSNVPQGSVLGTPLFLLYINGVTDVVMQDCNISYYADDSLLFCEMMGLSDFFITQENTDLVKNWFEENFKEFNVSKGKFMVI